VRDPEPASAEVSLSAADYLEWERARRRAARLQPDLSRAVLRAFDLIRQNLDETDLHAIIESHALDRVVATVAVGGTFSLLVDRAFVMVSLRLRETIQKAFVTAVRDLPNAGRVNGVVGVAFDYLSPNVVQAVRALDSQVVQGLSDNVKEVVKAFIENGLRDGDAPATIARELRSVIGLSPTQLENVVKYEAKLQADATLSDATIERMVATYMRRAVALNTETITRTASLQAMKLGQDLAWQDAADKGIVDLNQLNKTWKGVMDDRERDSHVIMEGETVPYDQPYSNGQMIPGEDEYNCRCISLVRVG
jgi:F like protein